MGHIREHSAGILVVVSELGAAVIVREGDYGVHAAHVSGFLLPETAGYLLSRTVHAAYGRNHPDLVTYAYVSVRAPETLEAACPAVRRNVLQLRTVAVFQHAGKCGLYAAVVYETALWGVFGHAPYREAVLDHFVSFMQIGESEFVPGRNVLEQCRSFGDPACGEVREGHGHIVRVVYVYPVCHIRS